MRPCIVNIMAGATSYELQIWWELAPWIVGVYPSKGDDAAGKLNPREEDECFTHEAHGASCQEETGFNDDVKSKNGVLEKKRGKNPIEVALAEREAMFHHPTLGIELAEEIRMNYGSGANCRGPIPRVQSMPLKLSGGGLYVGLKGLREAYTKQSLARGPSVHEEEFQLEATIGKSKVTLSEEPRDTSMPCASRVDRLEEDKG